MNLRTLTLTLSFSCFALLAGCSAEEHHSPAASGHASPDAVPGSHDDWCAEHEVPESQCTRCDPALSAAFKATNDWCAEHALPESQCLRCNPTLVIARPAKPEGR